MPREEYGRLYKPGRKIKVALVFPDSYYLGMSSLGFQVICHEINQHPDISCERVFFQSDTLPRSFETQRALSDFDIIGFSISFELDYFNVIKILHKAGIPLKTSERSFRDPFIIAGGICPSFNPEPLSDFIDAFIIGDGEEVIHELLSEYQSDRQELLLNLSQIKGVYVPSLYESFYNEDGTLNRFYPQPRIERRIISDLDQFNTVSRILTPDTEFANTFLVEVSRGCMHRCRFCVGSYIQKYRFRSADNIIEQAKSDLVEKANKIGLVGSSVTDHPQIDYIVSSLMNMGRKITFASLRSDSVSETILDALVSSKQETITLAPEAGSERLRDIIGKDISLEVILEVIESALKKGMRGVKLYFMIGLPTETQEDVESIVTVVRNTKKLMQGIMSQHSPRLTISVSPFVPKPQTPFQWYMMDDVKSLAQKLQFLKHEIGKIGGVRFTSSSARWSAVQGILSRGDRRLVNVLYDMQMSNLSWNKALKENKINPEFYLKRPRGFDELFPWDYIKPIVSKERLIEQNKSI